MNKSMKFKDGWTLGFSGKKIAAAVPGDVSLDLYRAGEIADPYFGMNHKELSWIINCDFEYENVFTVPEDIWACEEIMLEFDGIDTFSEIYLNGKLLARTENMFLKYSFNVTELLGKGENTLKVKMISTGRVMDSIDDKGYFGVFNVKRLFIRKAQCHFGWDWAPDMPGYGIHGEVRLMGLYKNRIEDISYKADTEGNITLYTTLNYNTRPYVEPKNNTVLFDCPEECRNDKIRYIIAKEPDLALEDCPCEEYTVGADGRKNFVNFKIKSPKLWWPSGYGEQPLYSYRIELLRNDKVIDTREGVFAFRECELRQKPLDHTNMSYQFFINGTEVFIKGSNWVPAECFIGSVKDEKYERLIKQARDANLNMLRVWGGGLYEKDIFYDICDREGILVWQDLMFACADIPEDDPAFVENCKAEITYQMKRLRNHPSIVYWCGGNEKTGSYGLQVCHGDYFVDVFLRGMVMDLDDTRPYARQSPCSLTDVGNDKTSGESHAGSFEACLDGKVLQYRDVVSNTHVPFISECAIMGPTSLEGFKKMFPEEKLWPMNEYWDDRLMDNPYAAILMTFARRQKYYSETLYGECKSITDFIAKGMTVHAETIRAEAEYARFNKARCGGFMNWMYNDIWPSATWSVVDYYCEPKQVYYQMKRSYAPLLLTFVQGQNGVTEFAAINDMPRATSINAVIGQKTLGGELVWKKYITVELAAGGAYSLPVEVQSIPDTYLFVGAKADKESLSSVYSPDMWHSSHFTSDYRWNAEYVGEAIALTVKARAFAKGVTVRLPDNCKYTYSDNYFDVEAGEEKTIYIYGASKADIENIVVTDFAKETL